MDENHSQKRRSQRLIDLNAPQKRLRSANDSFDPDQKASISSIMSLPNEILYMVKSHMEKPWQISLALTCKRFKAALFPENGLAHLSKKEMGDFLVTLAKDIPNIFFCFCCNKLHPLNPNVDWDGQSHRWTLGYIKNSLWPSEGYRRSHHTWFSQAFFTFMESSDIYFMNAYLVMDRHFNGPSHGIPLQSMERSATYDGYFALDRCSRCPRDLRNPCSEIFKPTLNVCRRKRNAWRFSIQSIPKILNNRLYIARRFTIVGPLVCWEQFATLVRNVRPLVCQHMACSAPPQRICEHTISDGPRPRGDRRLTLDSLVSEYHQAPSDDFEPERGSCFFCATDYNLSLKQDKVKEEWNFVLNTYHCLGSCRTPDDQLWVYFTTNGYQDDDRFHDYSSWGLPPDLMADVRELRARCLMSERGGARRVWHEAT